MKLVLHDEAKKFKEVNDKMILLSKRTMADAVNSRMAFVLMRVFVLMPPKRIVEQRDKIRSYLAVQIGQTRFSKTSGKLVGQARRLRRDHLIVQARRKKAGMKGAYGAEMKKAVGDFRRTTVGSIGYLKSGFIQLIKKFNGHFTQLGTLGKKNVKEGKEVSPNVALIKLLGQYGLGQGAGNVGVHKGVKVASNYPVMSLNPRAIAQISLKVRDGQEGKVQAMYDDATMTALHDERKEMERILAVRMQGVLEASAPRR